MRMFTLTIIARENSENREKEWNNQSATESRSSFSNRSNKRMELDISKVMTNSVSSVDNK
jgi:hypothetical protein